jgi:hypothetical protein
MAVADYFDAPTYPTCYYQTGPCGTPSATGIWEEEDAGKEYLKVCDNGTCHFEYLGNWTRCEEDLRGTTIYVDGGPTECRAACLTDSQCTTLTDFHYLSDVPGCYLYKTYCGDSSGLPIGDGGKYYRKVCSYALDAGIDGGF